MQQHEAFVIQDILEDRPINIEAFYARISTYDHAESEESVHERITKVSQTIDSEIRAYLDKEINYYDQFNPISRAVALHRHIQCTYEMNFSGINYFMSDAGTCFITSSLLRQKVNCIGNTGYELILGLRLGEIFPLESKGFHAEIDYGRIVRDCYSPGIVSDFPMPVPHVMNQEYRRFFAHVLSNRGKDQLRSGNTISALNDFEMACSLSQDYALSRLYKGVALFNLSNVQSGEEDVSIAYRLDKIIVNGLLNRGAFTVTEHEFIRSVLA